MADGSRNLIVLADGTGNSAAKPFKTNVWRLYQALDLNDGAQVAMFGDGVGTSSVRLLRVLGLAFGFGVKRNVIELYKFLCRNYNRGDRIWMFGFSRGAFTIRVLAGLIRREGLVSFATEAELARHALAAYRAYRIKAFPTKLPWLRAGRWLRDRLVHRWNRATEAKPYEAAAKDTEVEIRFLGVWDTVVAYGLPIDELTQAVDRWVWPLKFRDDSLLPNVRCARHALSLDDERRTFFPIPWNEAIEKSRPAEGSVRDPGRLRQVWFPGAHADVGGGYPDDGLSYVALLWMIDEAAREGLRFEPRIVETYAALVAPTGRIYDPRGGMGALWRYQPRDVAELMGAGNIPLVHGSAIVRMLSGNDGYAPISLPERIEVLPPHGAPIAFEASAVAEELAASAPQECRASPYAQQAEIEERRRFLAELRRLAPEAGDDVRRQKFALVRDTVWWRRVVYFISLLLALLAVGFPLFQEYLQIDGVTNPVNAIAGGTTGWTLGLVRGFLPGFAAPWLDAVAYNPAGAVLIGVGLVASLKFSGFLQHRIHDRARAAWNVRRGVDHLRLTGQRTALVKGALGFAVMAAAVLIASAGRQPGLCVFFAVLSLACLVFRLRLARIPPGTIDPSAPGVLLGFARRLRQSARAVASYRFAARTLAPAAFLAICAILGLSLVHRAAFDLASAAGAFCHSTVAAPGEKIGKATITTNALCNPTGLSLVSGRRYRVLIEADDAWFDKDVHSDFGGFAAASLVPPGGSWFSLRSIEHYVPYYAAAPLKRWWRENWFQPILRIGERGNYEQVLRPAAPLPAGAYSLCRPPAEHSGWAAIRDIPNPASTEFRDRQLRCEAEHGIGAPAPLISDFTADASGELFFYVNDAIVLWPKAIGFFYRNNSGTARVTVTRIAAPQVLTSP